MKVCGPTLSLCGLILSAWGVVQLVLMGVFYYIKSVALFEDIGLDEKLLENPTEFYSKAETLYTQGLLSAPSSGQLKTGVNIQHQSMIKDKLLLFRTIGTIIEVFTGCWSKVLSTVGLLLVFMCCCSYFLPTSFMLTVNLHIVMPDICHLKSVK